jgi:hypothetical protein
VAQADGPEPGIHVTAVQLGPQDLGNDATVPAPALAHEELRVICDQDIDSKSVAGKPTCFVTVELPYPLLPADISFWSTNQPAPVPVFGFQPLILDGQVDLDGLQTIRWRPTAATGSWLTSQVLINALKSRDIGRVLVRLTLKGNDIWSRDGRLYLDGEAFADTASSTATQTDWRPPSGDGRRGGDFEFWFWIRP